MPLADRTCRSDQPLGSVIARCHLLAGVLRSSSRGSFRLLNFSCGDGAYWAPRAGCGYGARPATATTSVLRSSASIRVRLARGSIADGSYSLLGREVSRLVGGHAMDSVDAVCDGNALASRSGLRFRVLGSRPTGSRICGPQGGGVC